MSFHGNVPSGSKMRDSEGHVKHFRVLFLLSLAIAAMALATPWLIGSAGLVLSLKISFVLALLWSATLVLALVIFRKRGLWFLCGLPPALYWSVVFVWVAWNCAGDFKALC